MPDTPMPIMACTMERGPLMLNQRLMLMLTTMVPTAMEDTTVWATDHTDMLDTPMPMPTDTTTARGPLMLSQRLMLMLMLTTATTAMVPGPTTGTDWDTEDTPDTMVWATDPTGDKFSASEVQSRSSKRTSLLVI